MRIALVGSAPSSINLAPAKDKSFAEFAEGKQHRYPPNPWADEYWEIWACSPGAFGVLPRFTRFFEVHRWEPGAPWFSPEYCQFLREFNGPVYTGRAIPEIKNHVVYPIERVEEEFSPYFLTSSLSLMMALAILEIEDRREIRAEVSKDHPDLPPDETNEDDIIGMWGVDMAATEEYGYQRAGCQFFVLEALKRDIGFYIPPESDLLRPMPVYGLCEWDHNYIKQTMRAREFTQRINTFQQQMQEASANLRFFQGAKDNLDYMANTWTSPYGLPHGEIIRRKK